VDRSDVLIIGGGTLGVASALFLAEAGARVAVFEAETIAAAASGRNARSCQHPIDPVRAPLATLCRRALAGVWRCHMVPARATS
jgi:glycine/D-amino acid oxidase-like deaminating enzyme